MGYEQKRKGVGQACRIFPNILHPPSALQGPPELEVV